MRRGGGGGHGARGASAALEPSASSSSSSSSCCPRIFFGKNKVMMVALGREPSSEYKENLHKVRGGGGPVSPKASPRPRHLSVDVSTESIRIAMQKLCR